MAQRAADLGGVGVRLPPRLPGVIARSAIPTLAAAGAATEGGMFVANNLPRLDNPPSVPKKYGDTVTYYRLSDPLNASTDPRPSTTICVAGLASLMRADSCMEGGAVLGGYITLTTGVLGTVAVHGPSRQEVNHRLDACNYKPEPRVIENNRELTAIRESAMYQEFLDLIGESSYIIDEKPKAMYLPWAILTLLMIKAPGQGFDTWLGNRIKSFTGTLGLDHAEAFWDTALFPPQDVCTVLYRCLSANYHLKNKIFWSVVAGATQQNNQIVSALCKTILNLLVCAEMSHIALIEKYLVQKYPELLRHPLLKNEYIPYVRACRYIQGFPDNEKPYIKLIAPPEETGPLNRNNFSSLTSAARRLAQEDQRSWENFATSSPIEETIRKAMEEYLQVRKRFGILDVIYSEDADISEAARTAIERMLTGEGQVAQDIPIRV